MNDFFSCLGALVLGFVALGVLTFLMLKVSLWFGLLVVVAIVVFSEM